MQNQTQRQSNVKKANNYTHPTSKGNVHKNTGMKNVVQMPGVKTNPPAQNIGTKSTPASFATSKASGKQVVVPAAKSATGLKTGKNNYPGMRTRADVTRN